MRFIMVKTPDIEEYNGDIRPGESVAVNVGNISSIKIVGGDVCLELSGNKLVSTQFTTIEAAVDFIQRAPSMSMGVS